MQIGITEKEKKYRFCEYCYQGYNNFMKLKKTNMDKKEELGKNRYPQIKEKVDDSLSVKHRVFFAENVQIPYLHETHNEIVARNIEEIISFIFKKKNIYEKWFNILKQLIDQTMKNIFLVSVNQNEFLEIQKIVKIKKIPYIDNSLTKAVNGVVCRKNISDKKMKNFILSPRLFIATQIDLIEHTDLVNFDNLIQNETKQIKKIINKIMKLRPDVILVEKSINRIAYEYFKEADIIVMIKVKHDLLKRIARVTKAKIIKDLTQLDKLTEDKILGTCEKLYIKKYFVEDYSQSKMTTKVNQKLETKLSSDSDLYSNSDPFFLFIETKNSFFGVTILISGPNEDELVEVKSALKMCVNLVKSFILEKDIVTNEMVLHQQINIEKLKNRPLIKSESFSSSLIDDNFVESIKNYHKREGDFSRYLFNKMTFEQIYNNQSIEYTKIWYVKGFLENCNEICANEEAVKNFYERFGTKEKTKNIFDYFVEICELPVPIKIKYYSEEDLTLG